MRSVFRAEDVQKLKRDPYDQDVKLDIERGESSPASDPHSRMQPEHD